MPTKTTLLATTFVLACCCLRADAQPPGPPPPKEYQVELRYRIHAGRTERLRQFFALLDYLDSLGFQKDPGPENEPEDANLNRMSGKIASANARRLLDAPAVKALLLLPPGFTLPGPDAEDAPVKVQLELVRGFPQQQLLWLQTRAQLQQFDFKEASGYDHRNYSRLVGTVRGGDLLLLLQDLRGLPAGWLAPLRPIAELPAPLREVSPVRVIEVIPEPEGVAPVQAPPPPPEVAAGQEHLEKLAPGLRALLDNKEEAAKPHRLEVILAATPTPQSRTWANELIATVPQLIVEGRLGPLVTVVMPAEKAADLAASPIVSTIRLPRTGEPLPIPATDGKDRNELALAVTGLEQLHRAGRQGQGVRVGIIAGDFRGWEALVKSKQLPAATRLVDWTALRNVTLQPEPDAGDAKTPGHGTQCARAVALAAPQAELLLIRVDPSAPYMLLELARFLNGEKPTLETMESRRDDLAAAFDDLQQRWRKVFADGREIANNFGTDEASQKLREDHAKKVQDLQAEEKDYHARLQRLLLLQREQGALPRLQVVVNTLGWTDGHAVDGSSPLTKYLGDYPFRATYWFQPAGDTRGQVWTGQFQDSDGNGIMEFAPPGAPLPPGRWTPELNFLGWRQHSGKEARELPANARLRLTIQWREAHEPQFLLGGEDLYREPLARLQARLFRQRDASHEKLPADDLELAAVAVGLPQRIDNQPNSSTYEQVLEFTVPEAGVYAVQLAGNIPTDIRPPSAPGVPALRKEFELRPRVLVEVLDAEQRAQGRPIFADFRSPEGSLTMPSEARTVWTIGAATTDGQPAFYSAPGPPYNLRLLVKPNALAPDDLDLTLGEDRGVRGSSVAASFAAGLTASALSAGIAPRDLVPPRGAGAILRLPETKPATRAGGR